LLEQSVTVQHYNSCDAIQLMKTAKLGNPWDKRCPTLCHALFLKPLPNVGSLTSHLTSAHVLGIPTK
jgi:hypothetical protein